MKRKIIKLSALLSAAFLTANSAQGATVVAGDLILFFQKQGDVDTVYVNLGSAASLYRGDASGPSVGQQALGIIDINTTLITAYGSGWASDTGIFAGLAGVNSTSTGTTPVNGDQPRTLYVSRARAGVGTVGESNSTQWAPTAGNNTSAATAMLGLTTNFATQLPNLDQGIVVASLSQIDNTNPFLSGTIQDTAFAQFVGGVQQQGSATAFGVFGDAGSVEFALDLQRLVPDATVQSGEVSGPSRRGSYEGTVTVDGNGIVSFVTVPEPSGTLALGILGTIAGLGYRRRKA